METITVHTGGGTRGNPGPAAVGVYITDASGAVVQEACQTIGNSTNNFAAYQAVALALETLRQHYGKQTQELQFEFKLDNKLVQKQLNAEDQIEDPGLVPMFIEIHNLRVAHFPHLTFSHIPSDQNQEADRLVNEALDAT